MTDRGDATKLSLLDVKDEAGTVVDPDELFLQIKSPKGDEQVIEYGIDAGLIRDSKGNYHFSLNPDEGGTWYYRWYTAGSGVILAEPGRILVTGDPFEAVVILGDGYPTVDELVRQSMNDTLLGLGWNAQLRLREAAIAGVEDYTGQSFAKEGTEGNPVAKLINGSGTREVYLPKRLISLSDLTAIGTSLTPEAVAISEDNARLFISREGMSTWVERALADTTERVFPYGKDVVTVTGVWGWEGTPREVQLAILADMEDAATAASAEIAPVLAGMRQMGVSSFSEGPLAVSFGSLASGRFPTLSPRAASYLDGFLWQRVGEVV